METEKKTYKKGGQVSRFEPLNTQELISSPFSKQCFQNVGCLRFCEQIQQVGYHAKLTSMFATNLRGDKVNISRVYFIISSYIIATTTGKPNSGEEWFKNSDLDISNYKVFIKIQFKEAPKSVCPFGLFL